MPKIQFQSPEMSPEAQAVYEKIEEHVLASLKKLVGAPVDREATEETVRAALERVLSMVPPVDILGFGVTHVLVSPRVAARGLTSLWGVPAMASEDITDDSLVMLAVYRGVDFDPVQHDACKLMMHVRMQPLAQLFVEWMGEDDTSPVVIDAVTREGAVLSRDRT